MSCRFLLTSFAALSMCLSAVAQPAATAKASAPHAAFTPGEARAARGLEAAKKAGAPELYAFLKPMPKGADLHMHLDGAVYAETFLAEAAEQGLCVDPVLLSFDSVDPKLKPGTCAPNHVSAADALKDETLYDKLVDNFSLRSFVPYAGWSGHDQFFATFGRFSGLKKSYKGTWLHEIAARAAAQNEQYLEVMTTPAYTGAVAVGYKLGWPVDLNDANHMQVLSKLRDALLAGGLRDDVAVDRKELAEALAGRANLAHCAAVDTASPSCHVQIHFLYQVLRGFPPQQVFAQTLLGFELASADPDVLGINFVRAEDRRDAMAEYHTEMLMLDYLHSVYPKVHISLHAGELAPGMVPPEGLSFHIREAVELGHAERIGHGVDVLHEDHPAELLKEMADKHIAVEINLTSNDVILGIKGSDHPLAAYRAAHVPAALSTDDEGVSRIDLTHEYARAVTEQNLGYADLKGMARTSLEHSFLPGESLWVASDSFSHRKPACAAPITATSVPETACTNWLSHNERAAQQWELERRFAAFEGSAH